MLRTQAISTPGTTKILSAIEKGYNVFAVADVFGTFNEKIGLH